MYISYFKLIMWQNQFKINYLVTPPIKQSELFINTIDGVKTSPIFTNN